MAFLLPRDPLVAARKLQASVAPGTVVIRRADVAALAEATALIEAARGQAAQIVAEAEAALEAERQRGYAEGMEQARVDQSEQMVETVGRTVNYLANVETEMVSVVLDSVRKIIDSYQDVERVHLVVKSALSVVRKQKQVTLRLHPEQAEGVRTRVDALLLAFPSISYLDIVPDARLDKGACILDTEIGTVEASIEGQLMALSRAFGKVLGSRP